MTGNVGRVVERVDGEHHRFVGPQSASLQDLTLQLRLHLFPCECKEICVMAWDCEWHVEGERLFAGKFEIE